MTFKATVLGATASLLAFGSAFAADLPSYKAPPPPPPPAVFDWSGYHIGVAGGYAGGTAGFNSTIYGLGGAGGIGLANLTTSYGTSGFIVGVQSGVNWQLANNVVVGYESDYNYTDVGANNNGGWSGVSHNTYARWLGTERLRAGYAFGRLLPYVTGGLAYGRLYSNGVFNAGGLLFPTSDARWQAGWTVGAGLEYALFNNFSVKAEYLYASLQGTNGGAIGYNAATLNPVAYRVYTGNGFDTHIARVGISYQIKSLGALIGMPQLGL